MHTASTKVSPRQKKVDRYLRAADIGTIALVAFFVAEMLHGEESFLDGPGWIVAVGLLALLCIIGSYVYMFARRRTDEYTLAMWHSGVTVAFFFAMGWSLFGVIVLGFIQGYYEAHGSTTFDAWSVYADWASNILVGSFYLGFHFKRFAGAF